MPDREKVIQGLKCCIRQMLGQQRVCDECPYDEDFNCLGCSVVLRQAIALLREQKPVVSCGDCKYWNAGTCLNDKVSWQIEDCGCHPGFITDSSWFCAEGERR